MKSDFQRQVSPNPSSYSIAHKLNLFKDNYPFQFSGHSHTSDQFDDIQLWRCSCFCKHHGFKTSRGRGRNLFQSQVEWEWSILDGSSYLLYFEKSTDRANNTPRIICSITIYTQDRANNIPRIICSIKNFGGWGWVLMGGGWGPNMRRSKNQEMLKKNL